MQKWRLAFVAFVALPLRLSRRRWSPRVAYIGTDVPITIPLGEQTPDSPDMGYHSRETSRVFWVNGKQGRSLRNESHRGARIVHRRRRRRVVLHLDPVVMGRTRVSRGLSLSRRDFESDRSLQNTARG